MENVWLSCHFSNVANTLTCQMSLDMGIVLCFMIFIMSQGSERMEGMHMGPPALNALVYSNGHF